MRLALVQQHATRDKADNVARGLGALEAAAAQGAQIVVFAELAFERFHPQTPAAGDVAALAETVPGPIVEAFQARARHLGAVVVLNLFERDGHQTFDTSPVIDADGTLLGRTRMVHITEYAGFHEQGFYTPGDTGAPVYDTRVGRIGVAICYDRHFPEYMRALALNGADLVVVPRRDRWASGPRACPKRNCRWRRFRTATSPPCAIAWEGRSPGVRGGVLRVRARWPRGRASPRGQGRVAGDRPRPLGRSRGRTRDSCSSSTAGPSCTGRGSAGSFPDPPATPAHSASARRQGAKAAASRSLDVPPASAVSTLAAAAVNIAPSFVWTASRNAGNGQGA